VEAVFADGSVKDGEFALVLVVVPEAGGLSYIDGETIADGGLVVVVALVEFCTAKVADAGSLGWFELEVIDCAAVATSAAAGEALDDDVVGKVDEYSLVKAGLVLFEDSVESFRLGNGAGEAVEKDAAGVGGIEEVAGNVEDDGVRDEPTGVEVLFDLQADLGLAFDVVAENIAGGVVSDTGLGDDEFGLGAFAAAGWSG
jgi:hypothetical protein